MIMKKKRPSNCSEGRASVPGSKGSLTIEAAMTLPLFFFAVLSLVYLLELQATNWIIRSATQNAAKIAAEEVVTIPILNPVKLKSDIVKAIGSDKLDQSMVEGGSTGISCWKSYYNQKKEVVHINVTYKMKLPFPGYRVSAIHQEVVFDVKAWTGFENQGEENGDEKIVYITDTGNVYHNSDQCTYLQFTIRFVPAAIVKELRSSDGGIYYACKKCVQGEAMTGVYIADRGQSYHNSLNCSGLKRCIRAVKKSEVQGRRECSRCSR